MKVNYKSKKCEDLVNQILICRSNNDIEGMQCLCNELKCLAEDIQDPYSIAAALFYMAVAAFIQGQYESTISLCIQLLNHCDLYDIPDFHAQTLNLMGIVYAGMSDFMASLSYLLKAYFYATEHEELHYCHFPLNNIGALFHNLEMPDLALKYFLKSYEYKNTLALKPTSNDAIPLINIIGANIKLKQYDEAEKWFAIYNREYKMLETLAIKCEADLQKIYLCYYHHDIEAMFPIAENLLTIDEGVLDKNRYTKILLELLEICYELSSETLAERVLKKLETLPENISDVLALHRLSSMKVKMALKFNSVNHDKILYQYYLKNEEYHELEKKNTRQSLLTKIDLENMLNEHHRVLLKNERLLRNNELDAFTGIYNKAAFKKHVTAEIHEQDKEEYTALLMIDIDDFKIINDTYGHYAGDQVILDVVGLLTKELQSSILVGRVGGDEFSVFFSSFYSVDYLYEKAEQYLHNTKKILVNDTAGLISLSIGIYLSDHAETFDEMYQKADHALYMAKRKGKGQYAAYSENAENGLFAIKETTPMVSLDEFLPSLYSMINTEYSEAKLFSVLEYCLKALHLNQAFLLLFGTQCRLNKIYLYDKTASPIHKVIENYPDVDETYIDLFKASPIYLIEDVSNGNHHLPKIYFTASMQCLIEFDRHKLGVLAFNDDVTHLWSKQELSLLRTAAAALSATIYYSRQCRN